LRVGNSGYCRACSYEVAAVFKIVTKLLSPPTEITAGVQTLKKGKLAFSAMGKFAKSFTAIFDGMTTNRSGRGLTGEWKALTHQIGQSRRSLR